MISSNAIELVKAMVGYHIEDAEIITGQGNPKLVLTLSHITEGRIKVVVEPGVEMRISGTTVTAIPGMGIVLHKEE